MKKLFLSLAVALFGTLGAMAQTNYEVPELSPDLAAACQSIIDLQLDDPEKANNQFARLMRKIRNKRNDLLAVGHFFVENKVLPCANQCARTLYEIAPEDIDGLMFSAEVNMLRKSYGEAGQKYDIVLSIDSTYVPALKRRAFIYKNVNPFVAVEDYEHILRLDPADIDAYRNLGDIYFKTDENEKAVANYDIYYAKTPKAELDVRSCENYVMALFALAQFDRVAQLSSEFAKLDEKDVIFKRMLFFGLVPTYSARTDIEQATAEVRAAMKYITEQQYADSVYINLDYLNASNFCKFENEIPEAINYMKKAIERDPAKVDNYRELSTLYRRNNQYDEAISTYELYMSKKGEDNLNLGDRMTLAQNLFFAAQQDDIAPELKEKYIAEGDAICLATLEKEPKAYQAYIYRGRFNCLKRGDNNLDAESAEDYAKAMEIMQAAENPEYSFMQDVSLRLAIYYYMNEDMENAKKYVGILHEVNPDHSVGKQLYEALYQ
ncbi:MAG: tetratricopeptide repeat protein [Prevotellaceae bacterium]|nr:tetratricopeptide repeat protein [Prevotellaceae bacterium]